MLQFVGARFRAIVETRWVVEPGIAALAAERATADGPRRAARLPGGDARRARRRPRASGGEPPLPRSARLRLAATRCSASCCRRCTGSPTVPASTTAPSERSASCAPWATSWRRSRRATPAAAYDATRALLRRLARLPRPRPRGSHGAPTALGRLPRARRPASRSVGARASRPVAARPRGARCTVLGVGCAGPDGHEGPRHSVWIRPGIVLLLRAPPAALAPTRPVPGLDELRVVVSGRASSSTWRSSTAARREVLRCAQRGIPPSCNWTAGTSARYGAATSWTGGP